MSLLKIARLGHPAIRTNARALSKKEIADTTTQKLIDDMIETMRFAGGVGLAATQVCEPKRMFVMEVKSTNPRYTGEEGFPLTVLINPEILHHSEEMEEGWEGCLSIPDLRGMVPRYTHLVLGALDRHGRDIEIRASGFPARVIQHEIDHLDGKVFLDRMKDFSTLTHLEEFEEFWSAKPF
jgi:peptide deformylase